MTTELEERPALVPLSDTALITVYKHTATHMKLQFYFGCDASIQRMIRKRVDFGSFSMTISNNSSVVYLGSLVWIFNKSVAGIEGDIINVKMDTWMVKILERKTRANSAPLWFTQSEDPAIDALTIARLFSQNFQMSELETLQCHFPINNTDAVLELLSDWDPKKFNEFVIRAPPSERCGQKLTQFVHVNSRDWDIKQYRVDPSSRYRIIFMKNTNSARLPIDQQDWFKRVMVPDRSCEYIFLSNCNLDVEHINHFIKQWSMLKMPSLTFVKIIGMYNIRKDEILSKVVVEEIDEEFMENHRSNLEFSRLIDDHAVVIRNASNKLASIHIDQLSGTFTFLVWATDPNLAARNLSIWLRD